MPNINENETSPLHRHRGVMLRLRLSFFLIILSMFTAVPINAQTFEVLYSFRNAEDGYYPVIDARGNLYGLAEGGNQCVPYHCGRVFQLAHQNSTWFPFDIYKFTGGDDGSRPNSLMIGPDSALYGTTSFGGNGCPFDPSGCGTVFRVKPSPSPRSSECCGWAESVLHAFGAEGDGSGIAGAAAPVFDKAGNLYGTTQGGGAFDVGVVYQLTPTDGEWIETILHNFGARGDGIIPVSGLTIDQSGNLYGTTEYGGQYGWGCVYQLYRSGSGWTEKVIYSFQGKDDGWFPVAGLTPGPGGTLYGATWNGGSNGGGVVFKLTPSGDTWTLTVLYSFSSMWDWAGPHADLALDSAGNLYGTTDVGGCSPLSTETRKQQSCGASDDYGAVFKLSPTEHGPWNLTVLHAFTGGYDGYRSNRVILDQFGRLYGTASGGLYDAGLVFRITP